MINSEVLEIRKQFKHDNCAITKISGCYVDGEKEIKTKFIESFLCKPEEETFKYFEIFKKTLSGTIGKNLINMEFPTDAEFDGGTQEFLLKLRDSQLRDEALVDEFYNKVIQMYDYTGNYIVLLIYSAYDVPGKTKDKMFMDDASEEVYHHILCSICPVKLSKPGLSYHEETNEIHKRIQDWVVGAPENGFLFPAFNERSTDIHSLLYYSKNPEELQIDFANQLLGCKVPLSAGGQKQTFQSLIQETLGEDCEYEIVRNIHDKLQEIIVEHKEKELAEPLTLDKAEVKYLFTEAGVAQEKLDALDKNYDQITGENVSLLATNVANTRVNPDRGDLIETKLVDGRKCLVIEINDQVEVNGIPVKI
jgi:hypothetical protein